MLPNFNMSGNNNLNISSNLTPSTSIDTHTKCTNKNSMNSIEKENELITRAQLSAKFKSRTFMLSNDNHDFQKKNNEDNFPVKMSDEISSLTSTPCIDFSRLQMRTMNTNKDITSQSAYFDNIVTTTVDINDVEGVNNEEDYELVTILEHNTMEERYASSLSLFESSNNISGRANPAIPTEEVFREYFKQQNYHGGSTATEHTTERKIFCPIVIN